MDRKNAFIVPRFWDHKALQEVVSLLHIFLNHRVQICMRYGTNPLDRYRECTINLRLDWEYM